MVATGKSPRLGLSTEFTRWKQRLDPKNAASTGMKPVESHGLSLRLVATNYRPTGIKPVVAKRRKKCFTALAHRGAGQKGLGVPLHVIKTSSFKETTNLMRYLFREEQRIVGCIEHDVVPLER